MTASPWAKSCSASIRARAGCGSRGNSKCGKGGGEYNVARGLRKCFGLRTAVVTAFADNDVGRLVEDFIMQGGVDVNWIKWVPYDGIGRNVGSASISPNAVSASAEPRASRTAATPPPASSSRATSTGKTSSVNRACAGSTPAGIFAALSDTTPEVVIEAVECARKHGTIVSYDLNYRPSLWKSIGGKARAQEVNRRIARSVDVMIGNEEDFTASLGLEVEGVDEHISHIELDSFKAMIERAVKEFPNFKVAATTLRTVESATINDWGAICWHDGPVPQRAGPQAP